MGLFLCLVMKSSSSVIPPLSLHSLHLSLYHFLFNLYIIAFFFPFSLLQDENLQQAFDFIVLLKIVSSCPTFSPAIKVATYATLSLHSTQQVIAGASKHLSLAVPTSCGSQTCRIIAAMYSLAMLPSYLTIARQSASNKWFSIKESYGRCSRAKRFGCAMLLI